MTASKQIAVRHFGGKFVRTLAKKGITFDGTQAYRVEFPNGNWDYQTAYLLNDNGTRKVRTFTEVLEIAK